MIRTLFVALFLVVFFIISLPLYLVFNVVVKISPKTAQKGSQAVVTWALKTITAISGIRLEVIGLENIPDEPALFIGNHRSFFDIVVTYPLMTQPTGYVAKKEVNKVALLKWWLPLLRCLTFDRDDPRSGMKMIIAAIDNIKDGYSMFIFPEGTRSRDGNLGEFKAGSFKVATRTNCPIIPVSITGADDVFERHIPAIRAADVKVVFGKPIYPNQLEADEKKRIAKVVREVVESNLD